MADSESAILHKALIACGKQTTVYQFLGTKPTTIICDELSQQLNKLGYRVTRVSNKRKQDKK